MIRIIKWIKGLFRIERVLFSDLDGTLIVTKSGNTFPEDCKDWKFKKWIISAIREYNPTHLHIISNQGGIESGYVDKIEFYAKMLAIRGKLESYLPKTKISFAYCTDNDKGNPRRKPNCGMIDDYLTDSYNNTDCPKNRCLMIGDASGKPSQFSDSDKKCAENANIKYLDVEDFIETYARRSVCGRSVYRRMKTIRNFFRKKPKKPTLREKVIELYGEEAGRFYDMTSSGSPIGGLMETIDFINKVETARKVLEETK